MIKPSVSLQFKTENLWTHFDKLDHQGNIPSPEDLFKMAVTLWNNYSSPGAFTKFMVGCQPNDSVVPTGEPWRKEEDTDPEPGPSKAVDSGTKDEGKGDSREEEEGGKTKGKGAMPVGPEKEFRGDHVLARSVSFMYEALVSKEVAQAAAEGDVGRVYEGVKVSRYLNYDARFPTIRHR